MDEDITELYERLQREVADGNSPLPRTSPNPLPTIHYTALKENLSGTPLARSWNVYIRQVGRLLEEGHEGKWVLIANEEIVGVFVDRQAALRLAYSTYRERSPMIHQVSETEPVYRLSSRITLCRNSVSPST